MVDSILCLLLPIQRNKKKNRAKAVRIKGLFWKEAKNGVRRREARDSE